MSVTTWLPEYQNIIEQSIAQFFDTRYPVRLDTTELSYESAIRYAIEWWGKRLRPILAMIGYEYISGETAVFWSTPHGQDMLRGILWIEYIHCYTLVHDDMPSMDNDEMRRGKLTVWKTYGEPMALLVGDTLQTLGFEVLAGLRSPDVTIEMARALWDLWVVRGQVRDTFIQHNTLSLDELLRIHDEKTGGFIAASLMSGLYLGHASAADIDAFRKFGFLLGRAFQVRDDILDIEWAADTVWKKIGKDIEQGKWIVPSIGIYQSKVLLHELQSSMEEAIAWVTDMRFKDIIDFVVSREK